MIKAIIFDVFETLVTHYNCKLYFGNEMAIDSKIDTIKFHELWDLTDEDRTIGKCSLEDALTRILRANDKYSDELLEKLVNKRIETKKNVFHSIEPSIIELLEELKKRNYKLGLISNCFSEEVNVIKESILAKYFDCIILSYEVGIKKPDKRIYTICMEKLNVNAKECIFVGDGGSSELTGALNIGITALQAGWFLRQSGFLCERRRGEFPLLNKPSDLWKYIGEAYDN